MNSKLRDTLEKYKGDIKSLLHKIEYHHLDPTPDELLELEDIESAKAEKAIRKAVAEDMLELLGDDAVITTDDTGIDLARKSAANYVLMELRQKIKEYGGLK